jgi:hypothetical protein
MKRIAMFFMGAALAALALNAGMDSQAEERYRMKYGRYTQAYEAQKKAALKLEAPACCRNMNASFKNEPRGHFADALFRSKYGRSTHRLEAGEKLAVEANAKHARICLELGKCTLMQARETVTAPRKGAPDDSWLEAFYRAKFGRTLETTGEEVRVAASNVICEHDCCKRAD